MDSRWSVASKETLKSEVRRVPEDYLVRNTTKLTGDVDLRRPYFDYCAADRVVTVFCGAYKDWPPLAISSLTLCKVPVAALFSEATTMAVVSQLSPYVPQTHFDTLVDDVLIQILSLLPVRDVLHLRQTSKRMEALSHVCAVWRALFARDVLTCGRPIPGFSLSPTPRLLQLCALDPSFEKLDHIDLDDDKYDAARELIEASDLEARTLLALRLEKSWKTSHHASATTYPVPACIGTSGSGSRTFVTPTPIRDAFLVPGGRLIVTMHADRLRCWDLGVPHASGSDKLQNSSFAGVKCVGELVFPQVVRDAAMCMDARPGASSVAVNGRHKEFNISFAFIPDVIPKWQSDSTPMIMSQERVCEILSVRLDPLRSVHGSPSGSLAGSPFSTPVPSFLREGAVRLPEVLPTPLYPEGSISAQTMIGEQWGPQRFSRGKLGKLLLMYGSVLFFESFIPAPPAGNEHDGVERKPKYVGIEVLDWNEPTNTVLLEYPDPQVGPYIGIYVHASAEQVLVVWQNCSALYPLPFMTSNLSSVLLSGSLSGSASGSTSACPSRPSSDTILKSSPHSPSLSPSLSTTPLSSSPGSPRWSLRRTDSELHADGGGMKADSGIEIDPEPEPEPRRVVTMPNVVFALSEPVEAPIAFSLCDVDVLGLDFTRAGVEKLEHEDIGLPHPLTIVARSCAQPSRNVQSVLTASPNPQATPTSRTEDKFTFRLSRIPTTTPDAELGDVAALALGPSGRGVRADANGNLFRCMRSEVVLPRIGYGFGFGYGFGNEMKASTVPTLDFWPWGCAAVLSSSPSSSAISEDRGANRLILRFDDGMGRIVAASRSNAADGQVDGTSEITILDFA